MSEIDLPADAIRQPVLTPDRDVRPFQDVLLDLGARLKLPGMIDGHGKALYPGGLKAVGESVNKPFLYYDNNVAGSLALFETLKTPGCWGRSAPTSASAASRRSASARAASMVVPTTLTLTSKIDAVIQDVVPRLHEASQTIAVPREAAIAAATAAASTEGSKSTVVNALPSGRYVRPISLRETRLASAISSSVRGTSHWRQAA